MEKTCVVCGEFDPDGKTVGHARVCRDCLREYCQREEIVEDFSGPFLEAQGADYYLSWWWEGNAYLTQEEKLGAVKSFYRQRRQQCPEEEKLARREYLREVFPEWENYLVWGGASL